MLFISNLRSVAKTNNERQRLFRERNPGYYGRLHRKRRARLYAGIAEAEAVAVQQEASVEVRPQLMLPAPQQAGNAEGVRLMQQFEALTARRNEAAVLVPRVSETAGAGAGT